MEDEIVNSMNGIRYVHRPYLKKSAYDEKEGVIYLTTKDFEDLNRSINPDGISERFRVSGNNIMDDEDKYGQYSRVYDFGDVGRHQICSLLNRLDQRVKDLEGQLDKIPPNIKEVWLDE
jgi:hypothetical protein